MSQRIASDFDGVPVFSQLDGTAITAAGSFLRVSEAAVLERDGDESALLLLVVSQSALCMWWSHHFCAEDERDPEGGGAVLKQSLTE